MKYYFEDKAKQQKLKKVLDSWVGTPYRHKCCVKQQGVDCIHFVGQVLDEMSIFRFLLKTVPDYPRDWHLHNTRELLLEETMKRVKAERVPTDDLKNGDMLICHFGKAASHAAIYFDGYLYHALDGVGVIKEELKNSSVYKNIKYNLRILA